MNDIKQVIVVRKDLNLKRSEMAAYVATASMGFLVDNNESERGDEISVKLSSEEAKWINGSFKKIVVGVDSEDEIRDLIFKAELTGIEVHPVFGYRQDKEEQTTACIALGPDESELVDQVTGHLKLI